jgi:hypothetical protein
VAGVMATGTVIRGSSRMVKIKVPIVSANGRYEVEATLSLPCGDPIPEFTIAGPLVVEQIEPQGRGEATFKLAMNSRTTCRDPDGRIKWVADTEPCEVGVGVLEIAGQIPPLVISTANIKTGEEHL